MSIPLPTVNLASVSIGQSGTVTFNNVGVSAGGVSANPANIQNAGTILIFNESGSGLMISFLTSQAGFYLPAGGWQPVPIRAGETGFKWTVLYNLPNPPVTLLLVTYYYPGEPIPSAPILGNSPIGIGGTVNTSSVNTLSNETNTVQTLVIDIGQVGHTLLITINSDGSFIWSVLQSGTAHQILQAQISGSPLLIGQTGDISEVQGNLQVDSGHIGRTGVGSALDFSGTGTTLKGENAGNIFFNVNGVRICEANTTGFALDAGTIGYLVGSISRINGGVASCGSGTTISHGLGVIPDLISGTPVGSQPFSATVGIGNSDSLDFEATVGAGSQIDWTAIKG